MLRAGLFLLFLAFIIIRPFLSSLATPELDTMYSWCLIFICAALVKTALPPQNATHLRKTILIPLVLFFAGVALSNFFSLAPERSLSELHKYLLAAVVFCAVFTCAAQEKTLLLFALIAGAGLVSLQAILWFFLGAKIFVKHLLVHNITYDFAFEFVGRQRAFVPFILPSALGGYLIMLLPLCISMLRHYYKDEDSALLKRPLGNIVLLLPVLLCSAALILTKAIGPLVSLLFGCMLYSIMRQRDYKYRVVLRAIILLSLVSVLIFVVRSYSGGYWRNPAFSAGQRQLYWLKTWLVIGQHPFTGVGLGNLPFVGSKFSHNSYLQIWAELGIVGFVALLGLVLAAIKIVREPPAPAQKMLHAGLGIAIFAFILHNLVDFTFFLPEVAVFWWITLGLIAPRAAADTAGADSCF
ncbi:MAG: O-antigen ligase family protein [Candidatus Omnitrophica bacterium]|nr:O-antigen ligase family protein [Candidatus Omnitrophota bacterium]MBU1926053.1 O-antigen ligase family protein [Candidatus Omnitrophota bacterium]MBU2062925.1 O-antigen ligase family protein [Candidatus Omnitrophota bacterium]